MTDFISLGNFQVESGRLMVTDPCYGHDGIHNVLNNVANGNWYAFVTINSESQIATLVATKRCSVMTERHKADFTVYVDSGQAGIFDVAHYANNDDVGSYEAFSNVPFRDSKDHEPWYKMCCDRTLDETSAGTIPFGVVSSSGYGDGGYECFYGVDAEGEIVVVQIVFIDPYVDGCDEEDCFDDEE